MKLLFTCALVFGFNCSFAQQYNSPPRDTVIQEDTINLRGVVYDYNSQPVKGIAIDLWTHNRLSIGYPVKTKTDIDGQFEFKGALPDDWLAFADGQYALARFFIRGSRFMVVYLPLPASISVNQDDSLIVKAGRKYPKIKPAIKIQVINRGFPDYDLIYPMPKYYRWKFIDYMRQNLVYPEKAIKNNIEGEVKIGFEFKNDGSLVNFKILKGIGYGCDEEVIELVKKAAFRPGIYLGKIFSIQEAVTVQFKLTDN